MVLVELNAKSARYLAGFSAEVSSNENHVRKSSTPWNKGVYDNEDLHSKPLLRSFYECLNLRALVKHSLDFPLKFSIFIPARFKRLQTRKTKMRSNNDI